jgi:hypothetical protein
MHLHGKLICQKGAFVWMSAQRLGWWQVDLESRSIRCMFGIVDYLLETLDYSFSRQEPAPTPRPAVESPLETDRAPRSADEPLHGLQQRPM